MVHMFLENTDSFFIQKNHANSFLLIELLNELS